MLVQRMNLEKGWLGRGVEGLPDCNDQNVELNGEGVEPDRHSEYRVNLLLIVTFLSGLNLERLLQFLCDKGVYSSTYHASHVVCQACVVIRTCCPDVDGVCGDVSQKPF